MVIKFRLKRDGDESVEIVDPRLSLDAINALNEDLNKLIAIGEISDSQDLG